MRWLETRRGVFARDGAPPPASPPQRCPDCQRGWLAEAPLAACPGCARPFGPRLLAVGDTPDDRDTFEWALVCSTIGGCVLLLVGCVVLEDLVRALDALGRRLVETFPWMRAEAGFALALAAALGLGWLYARSLLRGGEARQVELYDDEVVVTSRHGAVSAWPWPAVRAYAAQGARLRLEVERVGRVRVRLDAEDDRAALITAFERRGVRRV